MKKKLVIFFLFCFIAASFLLILYFNTKKVIPSIVVQKNLLQTQIQQKKQNTSLRIGFIPIVNAVQLVKQWQPFLEYLSKELKIEVDIVIKPDYQSVITGLSKNEMDVALLGSFVYIQAYSQLNIEPLVTRVIFGTSNYCCIVITRKDSGINTFKELKGKSFGLTDKNSTTGYLIPMLMMKEDGYGQPENFFSNIIYTGNHDSALLAVYNKSVDGASVSSLRWDPYNPMIRDLQIIWKSFPIPLGPFVVKKDISPDLIIKLKNAFLKIGKSPDTKELSRQMGVEGFSLAKNDDYDIVRDIQKKFTIKNFGD